MLEDLCLCKTTAAFLEYFEVTVHLPPYGQLQTITFHATVGADLKVYSKVYASSKQQSN